MAGSVFAEIGDKTATTAAGPGEGVTVIEQADPEVGVLLQLLTQSSTAKRIETLSTLRNGVKRNGSRVILRGSRYLFQALSITLKDPKWELRLEGILLIRDVIPHLGGLLDPCMDQVIKGLIENLGHDVMPVRRACLHALHVYIKCTKNHGLFLGKFVEDGLGNANENTRKSCIMSIQFLFTDDLAGEDLYPVVESLSRRLLLGEKSLAYPILMAMQTLQHLVGPKVFQSYLTALEPTVSKLYFKILENYSSGQVQMMASKMTMSNSSSASSRVSKAVSESFLEFGFIEPILIENLKNDDWKVRVESMECIKLLLKDQADNSAFLLHMDKFLTFLSKLLDDSHFKVVTLTLDIFETLISVLKKKVKEYLKPLINSLTKHLGDSKIVVREHNIRVVHTLMHLVSPGAVLDHLLQSLRHRNPRLREEIINRVTASVLTFPSSEFDFYNLCHAVSPSLVDPKRRVRLAAMECFAVLAQTLGHTRMGFLVSAIDNVELNYEADGLMSALQTRLARRVLPRCSPDGVIVYALTIPSSSAPHSRSSSPSGLDIDWIVAASGSTSSATPPSKKGLKEVKQLPNTRFRKNHRPNTGYLVSVGRTSRQQNLFKVDKHLQNLNSLLKPPSTQESEYDLASDSSVNTYPESESQFDEKPSYENKESEYLGHLPVLSGNDAVITREKEFVQDGGEAVMFPQVNQSLNDGVPVSRHSSPDLPESVHSRPGSNTRGSPFPLKATLARVSSGSRRSRGSLPSNIWPENDNDSKLTNGDSRNEDVWSRKSGISHLEHNNHENNTQDELVDLESNYSEDVESLPVVITKPSLEAPAAIGRKEETPHFPQFLRRRSSSFDAGERISHGKKVFLTPESLFQGKPVLVRSPVSRSNANSAVNRKTQHILPPDLAVTTMGNSSARRSRDNQAFVATQPTVQIRPSNEKSFSPSALLDNLEDVPFSCDNSVDRFIASRATKLKGSLQDLWDDPNPEVVCVKKPYSPLPNKRTWADRLPLSTEKLSLADQEGLNFSISKITMDKLVQRKQEILREVEERKLNRERYHQEQMDRLEQKLQSCKESSDDELKIEREPEVRIQDVANEASFQEQNQVEEDDAKSRSSQSQKRQNSYKVMPTRNSPRSSSFKTPRLKRKTYTTTSSSNPSLNKNVGDGQAAAQNPNEILKRALKSFTSDSWNSKVDAMQNISQVAASHPDALVNVLHPVIVALSEEVKNLRSSVSRTAITTLGDLFLNLKKNMESELEFVVKVLLHKSGENTGFIREDIERTLTHMIDGVTLNKAALAIINGGASHRNSTVRKTTAQLLSACVDRLGANRCLVNNKELTEKLLPAASQFVMDAAPLTRFFGRKIFHLLLDHPECDRQMKRYVQPGTLRNISNVLDSILKKGIGEMPNDTSLTRNRRFEILPNANGFNRRI